MPTEDISGTLSTLVKEAYPDDEVGNMIMQGSLLFAEMGKDWKAKGTPTRVPVKFSSQSGSGNDFAESQLAYDEAQRIAFRIPYHDDFALFRITDKALAVCQGDEGAIADVLDEVTDDAYQRIERNMHRAMWRNGSGQLGVMASGTGGTTIQLASPADIVHFQANDMIESYTGDGTLVTAGDGTYYRIATVNEDDGTITKTGGNWGAVAGTFDDGDGLYLRGTIGKAVRGVSAWIPATAPGATLYYEVDRTANPTALGGVRCPALASDGSIRSFLIRFASRLARGKAKPTHCGMNPVDFGQLCDELGDLVKYEMVMPKNAQGMPIQGAVGFPALIVTVGSGIIKVFSEADIPYGLCYMLTMSTWKIRGPHAPKILGADGLKMARMTTAAAYEGRFGCFWHIACNAPGLNGVGDLSAVQAPLV